jgi:o-succinylbenzoate---CoA ligase
MMVEPWILRAPAAAVAVETASERLTYGELAERARGASYAPGQRVPLVAVPTLDFVVALWACLLAGAVAMPVDPRLGGRERDAVLAGADGPPSAPGTALIVHTSGTTGTPRPVELTYGNLLANALGCAVALGHDKRERWLCPLPLSHVGGLMVLIRSAIYGTTAVLDAPERDDVTIASMVPTQLARLIAAGVRPGRRLRTVMLGGAAAEPRLLDAGWPAVTTYGMTQTCSAVVVDGRPLPNVEIRIAPERSGGEGAARGIGEILVAGPSVAGGGTLRTGDLGWIEDGRLIVTGRKTDTIVTGGENVAPAEVESALLEHPAVAEAGVFGRADPEWGEAVTAHVVLRADASESELRGWCAQRLAGFKVPKAIVAVDALPRNASGKLLRREMA